jgi:hypothetical protein
MKGMSKAILSFSAAAVLAGCSSMVEIPESDTYAQPKWYADCEQAGTEGMFWWANDYAYACGAGVSSFEQAAESEAYAFAIKSFAERINGKIDSSTKVSITDNTKTSTVEVNHSVTETEIREHLEVKRDVYRYQGRHYIFVRLKMHKETFDRLMNEADNAPSNSSSE